MIDAPATGGWRRRSTRTWLVGGLLLAVLVGALAGIAARVLSGGIPASTEPPARLGLHGEATWAEGAQAAPAIAALHDQSGHLFSLASLRGRSAVIVFFDSHCHQECPLEGRALAHAEAALPATQRPVLVAVSVNPFDTRRSAAGAVRAWGLAGEAPWYWLRGTHAQLARVWAAYHIYVAPRPVGGDIAHTEALYLVDRRGYERSAYLWPFATRFVTMDLRTLARVGRS